MENKKEEIKSESIISSEPLPSKKLKEEKPTSKTVQAAEKMKAKKEKKMPVKGRAKLVEKCKFN